MSTIATIRRARRVAKNHWIVESADVDRRRHEYVDTDECEWTPKRDFASETAARAWIEAQ